MIAGLAMLPLFSGVAYAAVAAGSFGAASSKAGVLVSPSQSAVQAGQGRGGPSAADPRVRAAINANIVMRGGKPFPKLPVTRSNGTAASCDAYDTRSFSNGAPIDLHSPDHTATNLTYPSGGPMEQIHSPTNADWVIQSYQVVVYSSGQPYEAGATGMPGTFNYSGSASYSTAVSTLQSYVASLNIPDTIKAELSIKLQEMANSSMAYAASLSSSHSQVKHHALVRGVGRVNLKTAHSWYQAHINGVEICSPAYLRDPALFTTRMKTWIDNVVAALPRTAIAGPTHN